MKDFGVHGAHAIRLLSSSQHTDVDDVGLGGFAVEITITATERG